MATAKPKKRKFNIDSITTKTATYRLRKHKGVNISLHIDKVLIYLLWFKPQTGYKSYAWTHIGASPSKAKYYCGKKKMMAAFLAHFKEHYGQ